MADDQRRERGRELLWLVTDGMIALSFTGVLTLAFLTPLPAAGKFSACCFALSMPLLGTFRFAAEDAKPGELRSSRPLKALLLLAMLAIAVSLLGFSAMLWMLYRPAAVIFGCTSIGCLCVLERLLE